ncbi:MAG TPA: amino acid adenylation domain-containing protein [Ktedonobacterales bacterium]|nr:amino acid adenylation domain-containing protein [Ktedonobacterales bacterium]
MADTHASSAPKRVPLSFAQQRIWFLDRYESGHPVFHQPFLLRLMGPLDIPALERSLNELLSRHETLRATFALGADQPIAVIGPAEPLALTVVDLASVPEARREAEALRLAAQEARQPFDLTTGPLLRAALWRLHASEHLLLLTSHQISADTWSMRSLARELVAVYAACAQNQPAPLPPALQYADVAQAQREHLQGEALESLLAYWRPQLADMPPLLVLPTDHPRPGQQSYRGTRQTLTLSRHLTEALRALSEQEGATLFMTLLAAFNILLYRTSGQTDISVGSPIANRNAGAEEHLVGLLSNMLVLRNDLSEQPTFRAFLGQVRRVTLEAQAHSDLPFEKLVEALNPAHTTSHTPLFQVSFALDEAPLPALRTDGLTVSAAELERDTALYDLALELVDGPEGITGSLTYVTDLFDAATITRMIGHFQTLLESVVADPDQSVLALPLLTEPERHQLLVEWNQTQTDHSFAKLAHQLFEEQAERVPDAPAARCAGEQLNYRELNQRANRLARLLVKAGVGPDVVVGLLAERGIDFLTTMLAVFKAGGAYLPLDPQHPARRYYQVLSQSRSALVLTTGAFVPTLSEALAEMPADTRPPVLLIEDLLQQEEAEENLPLRCTLDNLAYVIYTSGSTGMPKGAMVEQRGMLNHLYAKITDLQLTERDCIAETASQCFDISVWQFLAALLLGGTVHVFKDDIAHNALLLLKEVDQHQISILETVPSLLRTMLESKPTGTSASIDLPALRGLVPTGEALPPELARQWLTRYPHIPMLNAYGPTECSDDVTHYPISEPPPPDLIRMPIGRPIINMQMYVLDKLLQPVPIGVIGELYVGGIGVGRGYLNAPDKTAEAFSRDPFAQEPGTGARATNGSESAGATARQAPAAAGARLYRTGDLARYLPDGNLEFIGRADFQVKIRGFRIELGEIEAALEEHPAIQQALVLAKDEPSGNKHLVAYVVPEAPYRSQAEDAETEKLVPQLRSFLKDRLPDYMMPSTFVVLEAMPLNSNGKIDRKALPEPELTRKELGSEFVAPRTPLEESIAQIWMEVLGVERVGSQDNFLELGGHSLLAVQVISRLYEAYQIELPLPSIFEAPTVADLAEQVEQKLVEMIENLSEEEVMRRFQAI